MGQLRIARRGPGRLRTRPGRVLGDKAYSSSAIRAHLRRRGIKATIPQPSGQVANRLRRGSAGGRPPAFDPAAYKQRNTVERAFGKLRQHRAVATRYDKRDFVWRGTVDLVTGPIAGGTAHRARAAAGRHAQQEASWRERALNTEAALKAAHAEIRAQRDRIAILMGQARDAESEWTPEAIARITTENTTLKQRLRQLTQDNRALQERLQAARSNVRFADRRIAQLEAQLLDPAGHAGPAPS
jgi:transposase